MTGVLSTDVLIKVATVALNNEGMKPEVSDGLYKSKTKTENTALPGAAPGRHGNRIGQAAPGRNGLPSEAGMFRRIHAGLREISASTTMVAA